MDEQKRDIVAAVNMKTDRLQTVVKAAFTLNPIPMGDKVKVYVKCSQHDLWTKPLNQATTR